jgi:hypothetical protein
MVRADGRRRWRAWLGVVLIVGLFGGVVTATTAGARRTDNAYSRFVVANHGAEYLVDDFVPNPQAAVLPPATVAALPAVAEADSFRVFGPVDDVGYNLVASPDGRAYGTGLSRLKVLRGRLPDPARAGEAVADFTMPGARIGERVRVPLVASAGGNTHDPDLSGDPVWAAFTVVGIVAAPAQFPPFAANSYFNGPNYYLTPAFYLAHQTSIAAYEFSLVRLRPGTAAAAERQLDALGRGRQVSVLSLDGQDRDVNRSTHLGAVALWLLAGLLAVVAVLVLGQLMARQITLDAIDYPVLHSLGMTRRQLAVLAVLRCAVIGAAGAILATGLAIALSPLTPIGLARTAEPAPGFAYDTLVLVGALAGITVIAAALALWPAWRAATAATTLRGGDPGGLSRRSAVADASARAGHAHGRGPHGAGAGPRPDQRAGPHDHRRSHRRARRDGGGARLRSEPRSPARVAAALRRHLGYRDMEQQWPRRCPGGQPRRARRSGRRHRRLHPDRDRFPARRAGSLGVCLRAGQRDLCRVHAHGTGTHPG